MRNIEFEGSGYLLLWISDYIGHPVPPGYPNSVSQFPLRLPAWVVLDPLRIKPSDCNHLNDESNMNSSVFAQASFDLFAAEKIGANPKITAMRRGLHLPPQVPCGKGVKGGRF
jgi:hypothetical protein